MNLRQISFVLCLYSASLSLYAEQAVNDSDWRTDGFSFTAKPNDQWHIIVSPVTYHFNYSPEHKHVYMLGVERQRENGQLAGAAVFSNSFGQPSALIYPWGKTYLNVLGMHGFFVQWKAGLMYGYKKPYENKVPMNVNGFSPAIIPAFGWQSEHGYRTQINILGTAGVMLQFSKQIEP